MTSTTQRLHADHPSKPGSPTDISKPAWKFVARRTVREFLDDECTDIAAALTYYGVLSIFPALIALVSILGVVGQAQATTNALLGIARDFVPEDALQQLTPVIEQLASAPGAGIGLVVGLLTALWTASNYVNAFSRAMNRIYEISEGRPFWKLRPIMFGVTAAALVLVALAALLLVVSGPLTESLGEALGVGDAALTAWNIAKWPVLLVIVIGVAALLYYTTPNISQPRFRWITPGSAVAILLAVLASVGLGFYVGNFGSYNKTYGTLAGVIVFLLWLWIVNVALLFGAEVNAELERGRELQGGLPAEEEIQLPPRDTSASRKKAAQEREDLRRAGTLRATRGASAEPDGPSPADTGAGRTTATGAGGGGGKGSAVVKGLAAVGLVTIVRWVRRRRRKD